MIGTPVFLPIVVTAAPSVRAFLADRSRWAVYEFGRYGPPQLTSYFSAALPWSLYMVFGVCVEEVMFRGVLQRNFIARFGAWRGIALVGVTWAAFHFFGDRYSSVSVFWVLLGGSHRVLQCVVLGFVLSWLTLRSNSLWPAVLTHWLSNFGIFVMDDSMRVWWRTLSWFAVACVLYRYWSFPRDEREDATGTATEPEPVGA